MPHKDQGKLEVTHITQQYKIRPQMKTDEQKTPQKLRQNIWDSKCLEGGMIIVLKKKKKVSRNWMCIRLQFLQRPEAFIPIFVKDTSIMWNIGCTMEQLAYSMSNKWLHLHIKAFLVSLNSNEVNNKHHSLNDCSNVWLAMIVLKSQKLQMKTASNSYSKQYLFTQRRTGKDGS